MIDIHSHILPEVDDGPTSWEDAITMCEIAADDGIEHAYVLATSAYASFSGCRQYHEDVARARVGLVGRLPRDRRRRLPSSRHADRRPERARK